MDDQLTLGDAPLGRSAGDEARDWEAALRGRLDGLRLVLEIGLDDAICRELRHVVQRLGERGLLPENIGRRYPALLVTYLVAEGLFSYESGNYWDHVEARLRRDSGAASGRAFENAVKDLGLESFDDVFTSGVAYSRVNKILAHGGIPMRCLPDFFELLLQEVGRGVYDATEMLATWRQSRWRLNFVDQPVQRFFTHGGALAVDFLNRCIELVHESDTLGSVPPPEETALPPYVVETFAAMPQGRRSVRRRGGPAIPRPVVVLDPWSELGLGPVLELPVVTMSANCPFWRVENGEGMKRIEGSTLMQERVPLAPARLWECEYATANGTSRRFVFEGLSRLPALFFESSAGRLISDPMILSSEAVWVVSRADLSLTSIRDGVGAESRITEELSALRGQWSGYRAREVELKGTTALILGEGAEQVRLAVSSRPRPELVGEPVPGVLTETGEVVYAAPPSVRIPDTGGGRWHAGLRAGERRQQLGPDILTFGIVDLTPFVPDGIVRVKLRVTGALGSDAEFAFCVIPGLSYTAPRKLLTSEDGDVALHLAGGPAVELDPARPVVAATEDRVRVQARDRRGGVVDLVVQIPRLRWGVSAQGGRASLGGLVVSLDVEVLRDGAPTTLDVRTGLADSRLRLLLREGQSKSVHETPWITTRRGRWAFDLDMFGDTVAQSAEQLLDVVLDIEGMRLPVARVQRTYEASNLEIVKVGDLGGIGGIEVSFMENHPFNGRVLRAWPRWRPWEGPISEAVPDGQTGRASLHSSHLTPGDYLLELAVGDDAWTKPKRPMGAEGGVIVQLGDEDARAAHLAALPSDEALAALEAACADGRRLPGLDRIDWADARVQAGLAALAAITELPYGAPSSPALLTLIDVLAESPRESLRAIVQLLDEERTDRLGTARLALRLMNSLRMERPDPVEEPAMRALWAEAPILATVPDIPAALAGDEFARRRCDLALGWSPAQAAEPPVVRSITRWAVTQPLEQLWEWRNRVGARAQGLLDFDAYGDSNVVWILEQRSTESPHRKLPGEGEGWGGWRARPKRRPKMWFERHRNLRIYPIGEAPCGLSSRLEASLRRREPDVGLPSWAAIPQVTLAAAGHLVAGSAHADWGMLALDEALVFCPELVMSDVVRAMIFDELPNAAGTADA